MKIKKKNKKKFFLKNIIKIKKVVTLLFDRASVRHSHTTHTRDVGTEPNSPKVVYLYICKMKQPLKQVPNFKEGVENEK